MGQNQQFLRSASFGGVDSIIQSRGEEIPYNGNHGAHYTGANSIKYYYKQIEDYKFTGIKCEENAIVGFKKCESINCKLCNHSHHEKYITSSITHKLFVPTDNLNRGLSCDTEYVIYLLTCNKCGKQYVGQTKRKAKTRFYEHLNNISNKKLGYLYSHFLSADHSQDNVKFQILEILPVNADAKLLIEKERFWIETLVTAFPFGLNDNINKYGIISSGECNPFNSNNHPYFQVKLPRRYRSRGKKHRPSRRLQNNLLEKILDNQDNRGNRDLYVLLRSLSKVSLKFLYQCINDNRISGELYELIAAFLASKKQFLGKNKSVSGLPICRMVTDYCNPGVDAVKLQSLVKDKSLLKLLPFDFKSRFNSIQIVYKYEKPVSFKLLNFKKFLRNLDNEKVFRILSESCDCNSSCYLYEPAKHVFTGDIKIINNLFLRSLFAKGVKYRLPKNTDWLEVSNVSVSAIDLLISTFSVKFKRPVTEFVRFKTRFIHLLNNRINFLKNFSRRESGLSVYQLQLAFDELNELHDKYVITQADKAPNNYVIICKKYYTEIMCKELGVHFSNQGNSVTGNDTYSHINESFDSIVMKHQSLLRKFCQQDLMVQAKIPMLFATAKLHKNPFKFRFIAGASESSVKPIAVLLQRILAHLKYRFKAYCNSVYYTTKINPYWSVDNSLAVINKLTKTQKNVVSVKTFDFSTLFTKLPHNVIFESLNYLVDLLVRKKYIAVGFQSVYHTDSKPPNPRAIFYTKEELKELIQVVTTESYVTFAGFLFKQVKGIPMGGNSSPIIADLVLSILEYKFLTDKDNATFAKQVNNSFRYIDDLLCTCSKELSLKVHRIYPAELTLEATAEEEYSASFLDLKIDIKPKLSFGVYNKTDYFPFKVTRYTFSDSNVSYNKSLSVFYGEVIRYCRINTNVTYLISDIQCLISCFINNGFKSKDIVSQLFFVAKNYPMLFARFGFHEKTEICRFLLYQVLIS